jgi:hypothetical protein
MLGHELMLGSHVVEESDLGEGPQVRLVRRRSRLTISEESGYDDVIFGRIKGLTRPSQPKIIGDDC